MKELLTNFSLEQIIFFLFIIAIALKEVIELIRYFFDLINKEYKKNNKKETEMQELIREIKNIKQDVAVIKENNKVYADQLKLLVGSDREDIRAFIVTKHHFFVENQHWIDDYSMDVLEKRFTYYKQEGGNSYVETLMNEIRALPKHPPKTRLKE